MRVITESVRGITINWPRDMPLAYMTKVLEHLAYDRYIKEWSYVGGKWANLGHFEFKSLDGTDSGRMLEGDRIFVAKSLVKELGITQRLWMEDGAVEYGRGCTTRTTWTTSSPSSCSGRRSRSRRAECS